MIEELPTAYKCRIVGWLALSKRQGQHRRSFARPTAKKMLKKRADKMANRNVQTFRPSWKSAKKKLKKVYGPTVKYAWFCIQKSVEEGIMG